MAPLPPRILSLNLLLDEDAVTRLLEMPLSKLRGFLTQNPQPTVTFNIRAVFNLSLAPQGHIDRISLKPVCIEKFQTKCLPCSHCDERRSKELHEKLRLAEARLQNALEKVQQLEEEAEERHQTLESTLEPMKNAMTEIMRRGEEAERREAYLNLKEKESDGRLRAFAQMKSEMAFRETRAAEREAYFAHLEAEFERKKAEFHRQESEFVHRKRDLTRRESDLARKNTELNRKESEFAQKTAGFIRREADVARRDAEITDRENGLKRRETQLRSERAGIQKESEELKKSFDDSIKLWEAHYKTKEKALQAREAKIADRERNVEARIKIRVEEVDVYHRSIMAVYQKEFAAKEKAWEEQLARMGGDLDPKVQLRGDRFRSDPLTKIKGAGNSNTRSSTKLKENNRSRQGTPHPRKASVDHTRPSSPAFATPSRVPITPLMKRSQMLQQTSKSIHHQSPLKKAAPILRSFENFSARSQRQATTQRLQRATAHTSATASKAMVSRKSSVQRTAENPVQQKRTSTRLQNKQEPQISSRTRSSGRLQVNSSRPITAAASRPVRSTAGNLKRTRDSSFDYDSSSGSESDTSVENYTPRKRVRL